MQKPTKTQLIILIALAVACFGAGVQYGRYLQKNEQAALALLTPIEQAPAPLANNAPEEETPPLPLIVHVKGAVERPGVYELPPDSRVDDALQMSGALDEANLDIINLAAPLTDGMEIVVPFKTEGEETDWQALAERSPVAAKPAAEREKTTGGPVNINTADSKTLQTLNGIGPARAQAIIDYRNEHGNFSKIEDIKKVNGIGEAIYNGIKANICVE